MPSTAPTIGRPSAVTVASVLFGATTPEQVRENVRAAKLAAALTADQREALRAIGS